MYSEAHEKIILSIRISFVVILTYVLSFILFMPVYVNRPAAFNSPDYLVDWSILGKFGHRFYCESHWHLVAAPTRFIKKCIA